MGKSNGQGQKCICEFVAGDSKLVCIGMRQELDKLSEGDDRKLYTGFVRLPPDTDDQALMKPDSTPVNPYRRFLTSIHSDLTAGKVKQLEISHLQVAKVHFPQGTFYISPAGKVLKHKTVSMYPERNPANIVVYRNPRNKNYKADGNGKAIPEVLVVPDNIMVKPAPKRIFNKVESGQRARQQQENTRHGIFKKLTPVEIDFFANKLELSGQSIEHSNNVPSSSHSNSTPPPSHMYGSTSPLSTLSTPPTSPTYSTPPTSPTYSTPPPSPTYCTPPPSPILWPMIIRGEKISKYSYERMEQKLLCIEQKYKKTGGKFKSHQ